jgi:hypothetical protein
VIGTSSLAVTSVQVDGSDLVIGGTGPAGGTYHVLSSGNAGLPLGQWPSIATNLIGVDGTFAFTNTIEAGVPQLFYELLVPVP